jgi:hypothetical protein
MGFLILVVAFIAIAVWSVSRRARMLQRDPLWMRGRTEAAAISAIVILLPLAIWHYMSTNQIIPKIAALVTPYPNGFDPESDAGLSLAPMVYAASGDTAAAREALSQLKADSSHAYLLKTTDSPHKVVAYYRDSSHRPGWTLVADDSMALVLRRGKQQLFLGALDSGYGRGTQIIYMVQPTR